MAFKGRSLTLIAAVAALFATSDTALAIPTWAQSYGVGSFGGDRKATEDPNYGSGYDYPTGIAPMPDGGFVVAGRMAYPKLYTPFVGNPGGRDEATIVRFAADGAILWQRDLDLPTDRLATGGDGSKFFTPALCHVYQIAADASGNVFVGGGKGNVDNSGEIPFVAKFSPAGDLIWQNGISGAAGSYGDPPQQYTAGLDPVSFMGLTADGGVLITTAQRRPISAYTALALAKFDANGAVSLYRAFEHPDQYVPYGPVCQSADGSRYVTTMRRSLSFNSTGSNVSGTLLVIFDLNGNIIAQRGWASLDEANEEPFRIIATADGGFATMARRGDRAGVVIRKFNSDASATVFEKSIYMTPRFSSFTAQSLFETADGGFVIGAHTSYPGGSAEDVLILKINPNGTLQSTSLVGGPKNEAYSGSFGTPDSVFVTPTTDGGYGIACFSDSYKTGPTNKPDWWIAKTDANRRIRNFSGTMAEEDLGIFAVLGEPHAPVTVSDFMTPGYSAGPVVSSAPAINVLDPSTFAAPDAPSVVIQASGPRVVSRLQAEAVINRHFAYHIVAAFFDAGQSLTFNATGLPQGFVIDPKTGVISGVARPGSETNTPLLITLQVSDGTETITATLQLTIGVGTPVLTVNGSDTPGSDVADKPLAFAADYAGRAAGQKVSVQASTDGSNFTDLPTGTAGWMTFDPSSDRYVLNTTNYPQQDGVRFRVRVVVPGRPDVISNVVGPFNLASNKQRAGQTLFRVLRNGLRADFDFRATQVTPAAGVALRVQSSYTPGDEASWTDIFDPQGNNISAMKADNATHYSVATNGINPTRGLYFRAVAAASGFVDSLSNIVGPYVLSSVTPPQVSFDNLFSSDANNPGVIEQNADGTAIVSINVRATAGARPLGALDVLFQGAVISSLENPPSGELYTVNYQTDRLGLFVIEGIAFDDRGVAGRAGTPRYIRIVPPPATAARAPSGGKSESAATVRRELFTVANSGGNWDDPNTWKDSRGNPGVPGQFDFVILGSATVHVDSARVYALSMNGGRIEGPGNLQVDNMLTIAGGTFSRVFLTIPQGAICETINVEDIHFDGGLLNSGTINIHGPRGFVGLSDFLNLGTVNFQTVLLPSEQIAKNLPLDLRGIEAANIKLSGKVGQAFAGPQVKLLAPNAAKLIGNAGGTLVGNSGGTLISQDGGGLISNDGGSLISNDGGSVISNDGASVISNDGASLISQDGGGLISQDGGGLISQDGGGLIGPNSGTLKISPAPAARVSRGRAATASSEIVINAGEVDLSGVVLAGAVTLDGGVLSGTGIIAGSLTNNGGFISPGDSPGTLFVLGDFAQSANGSLIVEAAGAEAGQFDRIALRGAAALGGKLQVRTIDGYVPLADDPINPFGYASVSGGFDSVSGNFQIGFGSNGALVTIDPAASNPPSPKLLNIATRMRVEQGENALIAGFIITGSAPKKVIVRGLGPSIEVGGRLNDPTLELFKPDGSTVFNNNWRESEAEVQATTIPPTNDLESSIVATLEPGAYTAVLRGTAETAGVGLVEVYDLEGAAPETLANISTRGQVQTGDNVMIGGLIIGGDQPATVLIRAIGPSLDAAGVSGALQDPTLDLVDGSGNVMSNDNWRENQESDIIATTVPPANNREAAVLAKLPPGNYTAIVRGKADTTGVALVEAYNLQQ